jgi:hypothetical protein
MIDYLTQNTASIDGEHDEPAEPAELTALFDQYQFLPLGTHSTFVWLASKAIRDCDTESAMAYAYQQIRDLFPMMTDGARKAVQSVACDTLRGIRWRNQRESSVLYKPQPKGEVYGKISI